MDSNKSGFEVLKEQAIKLRGASKNEIISGLAQHEDNVIKNYAKQLNSNKRSKSIESLIAIGAIAAAGIIIKKQQPGAEELHIKEVAQAITDSEDPGYNWIQKCQRAIADLRSSSVVGRNGKRSSLARVLLGNIREPEVEIPKAPNTQQDHATITGLDANIEESAYPHIDTTPSGNQLAKRLLPPKK